MDKLEFISRRLAKAENKKYEHYVVTRIWHLLDNTQIKLVTQQYVTRPSRIEGDVLYLDLPYNAREYGANYHLLNTIALYDDFVPQGKTGLGNYERSLYCKKREVGKVFDDLIKNADFKYIFLSYNNEGLMSKESVKTTMEKYGRYDLATVKYQRFRADKTENRNHTAVGTTEYLHILEKS